MPEMATNFSILVGGGTRSHWDKFEVLRYPTGIDQNKLIFPSVYKIKIRQFTVFAPV
jgi:hypothetical protein